MTIVPIIILGLFSLPLDDARVYLSNTADSSTVEFYDCILHDSLLYCRRPKAPMNVSRSHAAGQCYYGKAHSLHEMYLANVSSSTVLHEWKSGFENVEKYIHYREYPNTTNGYVCECTDPQSFGTNCEYLLPNGTTFYEAFTLVNSYKRYNPKYVQLYGTIVCYETLDCNYGLLCLDWRDICDGVQQCMLGLDENNCDQLEFNECENDEYRCTNGMCIPEEYFLDGEFDCLDWSDEIQYYDDTKCPIEGASFRCDDRICPPNQWSCSDGQCIIDRLHFQILLTVKSQCRSRREQYFMCETHYVKDMWTLPNGRCYEECKYEEKNITYLTIEDQCQYHLRCALSQNAEKNCSCKNTLCTDQLNATCPSDRIQFPKDGIMAPYILFFYSQIRKTHSVKPDFFKINGTIKCNGILVSMFDVQFSYMSALYQVEHAFCQHAIDRNISLNMSINQHCQYQSLTFNNRTYSSSSICNTSQRCISTYRIRDGNVDCWDNMDEKNDNNNSIHSIMLAKNKRFRFRCSSDDPTFLSVTALGNIRQDCNKSHDELWFGSSTKLVNINCNQFWKDECKLLRQYIENSWLPYKINQNLEQLRMPFRSYCDTFWNLALKEDENIDECKDSWICSEEQWQCQNGQCINSMWVLDGEWDCFDASDEYEPFHSFISNRNLQVVPYSILINRSISLNISSPFSSICNLTIELPCFLLNSSHSMYNFTYNRPCISRQHIGNNQIDCYGAIDERNTITHCNRQTSLGYHFKCKSTNECIPYWDHCVGTRCNVTSDDGFWCDHQQSHSVCNAMMDYVCLNGTCIKQGRCNKIHECLFGEDEYMCEYQKISKLTDVQYRQDKQIHAKTTPHPIQLVQYPLDVNITKPTEVLNSNVQNIEIYSSSKLSSAPIIYQCNRGIGINLFNSSPVCLCPPQYYGDKCEYHTDRISVLIHLNLSQSIYTVNSDITIVLKMLVLFLFNDEILTYQVVYVRPAVEINVYTKKMFHLLYSRSSRFLEHKIKRYFNQSNIIYEHPYSIRIEMYEMKTFIEPKLTAVWIYPIYFDYLPVFRWSKVLRLTKPTMKNNPCSSYPCNQNQDCQQLMNDKRKYICLCKSNFTGENCSILDQHCIKGYCALKSLCKPKYRGLLIGNDLPYCVCPSNILGEQCRIEHDKCSSNPCQNNGSCFPSSRINAFICICTEQYHGESCELKNPEIKLYINQSIPHIAAIIQYFDIDFTALNLIFVKQNVYRTLPKFIQYKHNLKTAPEIILAKIYSVDIEFYLIFIQINVTSVYGTTTINEKNRCVHVETLISNKTNMTCTSKGCSPIKYHSFCQQNLELFCFLSDTYLCICDRNHSRVECFSYDYSHDQCSHCLAGGRCLQGDPLKKDDFICLCPPCHSGIYCQFNSNSFTFTLDQLFYIDLISNKWKTTVHLLIILPITLFIFALPNNLFSIMTFRRQNCLRNGISQYLLCMSIMNQFNLGILAARLIHLAINITSLHSHAFIDSYLCKIFSFLLTTSSRIVYWLVSLVAIQRVYMTLFLNGRWFRKPHIARRLMALTAISILLTDFHELIFVKSISGINDGHGGMCVFEFPSENRSRWLLFHLIISIINTILPFLINFCSTITISFIMTKKKMNTRMNSTYMTTIRGKKAQHNQASINTNTNQSTLVYIRTYLRLLLDVLNENKEFIIGPGITLVPQLFSLPLFVISFTFYCQNLETSWVRYLLVASYLTSFAPQLFSFILYILPSSFYSAEWYNMKIGQWIFGFFQHTRSMPATSITSGSKE